MSRNSPSELFEHLWPGIHNEIDLGSTIRRWRGVHMITGTVSQAPAAATDIVNKTYADGLVGSSLTVEEVDGAPTYGSISTIRFDQADGFVLTQPGANIVRIDLPLIAVDHGGTGLTSYTTGDIVYASAAGTLAGLADAADGNVLRSGGVGVAPLYGKVRFGTDTSGTLAAGAGGTGLDSSASTGIARAVAGTWSFLSALTVALGGTNITSYTAGDMLTATGATTLVALAKGTANQVIGMNSGATTQEYKSLTSTDASVTITHSAGGVNLAVPASTSISHGKVYAYARGYPRL